jgi:hypothetical protein
MGDNQDMIIRDLNEIIKIRKKELNECNTELKNWDYPYNVRQSLLFYKLRLERDF